MRAHFHTPSMSPAVSPSRLPSTRPPGERAAPPGLPRQVDLDACTDAGGPGGGLLGSPGSSTGGMALRNHPRTATRRRSPGHPGVVAPPPEAHNRAPATGATRRADPACPSLRRAARARRGRLPATNLHHFLSYPSAAALGFLLSAPAAGRVAWPTWSDSGASDACPGGGACGPFRAALIDVQKVLPHRPAAGCPVSGPA
ncbi:hypothetical protein HDA35_003723 [Micromonospora purpureochromogenes]|uniref:Uncharacterized protein n=1 Tax=Micromonospora purpureochromogenes TaxID=47872 RepID=A0ABX2RMX5_9ACTN|nr:hypothetical protein [Micromonospora purpureochromogenes]